jgi:hypothetical protein
VGKRQKKEAARDRTLKELDKVTSQGPVVSLQKSIAQREERLRLTRQSDDDSPGRAVREWEIRDQLRHMDESQRMEVLLGAVENGDDLTFHAVMNAPTPMSLVSEPVREQARQRWVEQKNPQEAAALQAEKATLDTLNDMIETVRNGLDDQPDMRQRLQKEAAHGE